MTCLQQALIAGGYSIPAGATGYFGAQTQAAVSAWQKATGVTPIAGYFGAKSRAAWNLGGNGGSTTTTTTTTTTTGSTTGSTAYTGGGNGLKSALADFSEWLGARSGSGHRRPRGLRLREPDFCSD